MATAVPQKPGPLINDDTEEFWESCKAHEMKLQQCSECRKFRWYPAPMCPYCGVQRWTWEKVSGNATVYAATTVMQAPTPAWANEVPYCFALIKLDEGPMMTTNVVGIAPDRVKIGMKVRVTYEDVTSELTVPKFQPQ